MEHLKNQQRYDIEVLKALVAATGTPII